MSNSSIIGRTVNYTGDCANAPRTGYVMDAFSNQWDDFAVIAWDDAGELGAPTSRITQRLIADEAKPGERFYFSDNVMPE